MIVSNLNSILPQEEAHKYFVLEGSRLYRKLASGAVQALKSMDGKQVVTLFKSHRLRAVDIAWCLIYGNWPSFPIVQLNDNPHDFSQGNLYPARTRRLRYEQRQRGALFVHPLSSLSHATPERCRKHWEELAADFYVKDLTYVLKLEEFERGLRLKALQEMRAVQVPVPSHKEDPKWKAVQKPSRPPAIPGREWHWVRDEWVNIPVACHVADDYRVRIAATLGGATWFQFDPEIQQVRAYLPDGSLWSPAAE